MTQTAKRAAATGSRPMPSGDSEAVDPRRWLTLAVLLLAGFMNLVDVTIVNVAIPSLRADLGASSAEIEWVVAAYILAFALGLLPFGRLGDIVGRKRMFLLGVSGFTLASALCGLAPATGFLIAARVLQGMAGALMMPQVLALVHVTFPPHERGFAFSFFGVTAGMASVAGPLAGGALISADLYDLVWRPIFLVNIPIGLFALAMGWHLIPSTTRGPRQAIDVVGVALAALTIFAIVFPLVEGREFGWPLWCFAMMVASLPLAIGFLGWEARRERRGDAQLLPITLLKNRHFVLGLSMTAALFAGIPGFFFVIAIFLQVGFDFTPLQSGVTTIPFPVGVLIASLISGRFGSSYAKARLVAGPLILAAGMDLLLVIIAGLGDALDHWTFAPPLFISGLGLGTTVAPLFATILTVVDNRDAGSASGALQTFQQIGGALGVAAVGQIFFGLLGGANGHDAYRGSLESALGFEMAIFVVLAVLASRLPSEHERERIGAGTEKSDRRKPDAVVAEV